MEEIAQVYGRALFEVAQERGVLDDVRTQLGQFADALEQQRELAVFFFSPYFSSDEKKDGLNRMIEGAEPAFLNFLEALLERHRMPAIFRIRTRFEELWDEEKQLLPVEVTSAVELDESTVRSIGERVGEQTGRTVELASHVDPEILGGIVLRVGNFILDASIRNSLNQLRKQVAQA
ncbi:MAG: ATP synthase F1 subunit delta [Solirubrobacteraceae bacterium]